MKKSYYTINDKRKDEGANISLQQTWRLIIIFVWIFAISSSREMCATYSSTWKIILEPEYVILNWQIKLIRNLIILALIIILKHRKKLIAKNKTSTRIRIWISFHAGILLIWLPRHVVKVKRSSNTFSLLW